MRILTCLALLALCGVAHAGPADDARAALALASARPPRAPAVAGPASRPAQAPPCGKSSCDCGCFDGERCRCAAPKEAVPELEKSYAAQYIADGWTWHAEGGYWYKYPEPVQTFAPAQTFAPQRFAAPQYQQFQQSFGGARGCAGGG